MAGVPCVCIETRRTRGCATLSPAPRLLLLRGALSLLSVGTRATSKYARVFTLLHGWRLMRGCGIFH